MVCEICAFGDVEIAVGYNYNCFSINLVLLLDCMYGGSFIFMLRRKSSISLKIMSSDFGIYGLTSQGIALALNIASKGYSITVGNKSSDKV